MSFGLLCTWRISILHSSHFFLSLSSISLLVTNVVLLLLSICSVGSLARLFETTQQKNLIPLSNCVCCVQAFLLIFTFAFVQLSELKSFHLRLCFVWNLWVQCNIGCVRILLTVATTVTNSFRNFVRKQKRRKGEKEKCTPTTSTFSYQMLLLS